MQWKITPLVLAGLLAWLFCPLSAQKLSIKMGAGLTQGGSGRDYVTVAEEHVPFVAIGVQRDAGRGEEIFAELAIHITPRIQVTISNGYISLAVPGQVNVWNADDDPGTYYRVVPRLKLETIPLCVSLLYAQPLTRSLRIHVSAGGGVYYGIFKSTAEWDYVWPAFLGRSIEYRKNLTAFGPHASAGLEYRLSEVMSFSLDVLYRHVEFHDFEGLEVFDSRASIPIQFEERFFPDFNYGVNEVSLSGAVLRAALVFDF